MEQLSKVDTPENHAIRRPNFQYWQLSKLQGLDELNYGGLKLNKKGYNNRRHQRTNKENNRESHMYDFLLLAEADHDELVDCTLSPVAKGVPLP